MVTRLTVALEQEEYNALLDAALQELRNPVDQLRYILRKDLGRQNPQIALPASQGLGEKPSPVIVEAPA